MTVGDILFFYHAASAGTRIAHLLKEARQCDRHDLVPVLERAALHARKYSGTIFGCTQISGTPEYGRLDADERHFDSRIFAPFESVHTFDHPLHAESFGAAVKISRQSALTALEGRDFDHLKRLLAEHNTLPEFLANARPGGISFRDVTSHNWRTISCAPGCRFIHEGQIRSYLIDHLLDELKDPRTSLLQECECFRRNASTGIADYFIQLHGRWLPVEAKLSVLAEPDLLGQVAQYIQIDAFKPIKGERRNVIVPTRPMPHCLIVDQSGLYIVSDRSFAECNSRRPYLTRAELGQIDTSELRERLGALLKP